MKIVVLGAGYVGLVSAACFAEFGFDVVCVDPIKEKIDRLLEGIMPIYEQGLDELVAKNVNAKRLSFATSLADCYKNFSDKISAIFIAVGTPTREEDGHADLSFVYQAADDIAKVLPENSFTVVVNKSTVPIGTGREIERIIKSKNHKADFAVASNPEFLREGTAIYDFMQPDRVVFGTDDPRAVDVMNDLYTPLRARNVPVLHMALESSELTKYAANAFLVTKVTFINEIADLCEKVGGNVQDVAHGIGMDTRIGSKFLQAGPGYGGSCFPKDALALAKTAQSFNSPVRIVETAIDINHKRKVSMTERVIAAAGGSVKGMKIAVLGVSFKPNTDDMRYSVALDMIPALQKAGATVQAFDPVAMHEAEKLLDGVIWADSSYEAVKGASIAVLLTEWDEFASLDFAKVRQAMLAPVLLDLRNLYNPKEMRELGFSYHSIGRS
ncbi:MAG: UDP-glucose/GDP-mannose dehydrogenase family protein [Alphaproteobacteria bacterium]|nr:UDP-glucose/GDP-mannose dehydrogenase family protein [Alphaproteobacteria bacterium]